MLSRVYLIQTSVCVVDTSLEETTGRTVKPPPGTDVQPLEGKKDGYNFYNLG
jgi:hypothetical protein